MDGRQLSEPEMGYWAERLGRWFERTIAEIRAEGRDDLELLDVAREARARVRAELGLDELERELAAIEAAESDLKLREAEVLRGCWPGSAASARARWRTRRWGIGRGGRSRPRRCGRLAEAERELLRGTPTGRLLLEFEAERSSLAEAVAMALAPPEVRRLWAAVARTSNLELSRMERVALGQEDPPR